MFNLNGLVMQYLEKCSYQQIARIRSILFIVNVLFVLSIIFFRSPAYIFLALIFTYSIAVFSDRLKQYAMVAHKHEIASRCALLLERESVPVRAAGLFQKAAKQAKARLFVEYFPKKLFSFAIASRPFCMAVALISFFSIAVEIFSPNLLPWNIKSSVSNYFFGSLLFAALFPLLVGYYVDYRARNITLFTREVIVLRLMEIVMNVPKSENIGAYFEQKLEPIAFYNSLFMGGKTLRPLTSYEESFREIIKKK